MLTPSQVDRMTIETVLIETAYDCALADAGACPHNQPGLRVLWEQYAQALERTVRVVRELQTWNTDPPTAA